MAHRCIAVIAGLIVSCSITAMAGEAVIARCSATGVVTVGRGATLEDAAGNAVTSCILKRGEPVCCQPKISTRDAACVAMAVDGQNVGLGSGDTKAEANEAAEDNCPTNDCEVVASICRN